MYENVTYEMILERMLNRIPNDIDKREGSIAWTMLAPAAVELQEAYISLDAVLTQAFADTASGEYLERRTAELGIERKLATPAIRKGVFTNSQNVPLNVPIGSRFTFEDLTFEAITLLDEGVFELQCETAGTVGNFGTGGAIIPIEYIDDLSTASLQEVITPGTDDETDQELYGRYLVRIQKQATSGNKYHYEQWALEIPGVANARCYPLWDGPGTVKVVVINNEARSPSPDVIQEVFDYIESVRPVNAELTVTGVTEVPIGVSATLTLREGAILEDEKGLIIENITKYFESIAFVDDTIRYSAIGNAILDSENVIDYINLTINAGTANIILGQVEVPVIGTITFTE